MFKFSQASLNRLSKVHPDMQKVAMRAIQISPIDFSVTQGLRTREEQCALYGKGRTGAQCRAAGVPEQYASPGDKKVTWTMNSNHLSGNAIDVAPFVNGKLEYDDNGKLGLWPKIAKAFKDAAAELHVSIEWGGDWEKTKDRPHFELVR